MKKRQKSFHNPKKRQFWGKKKNVCCDRNFVKKNLEEKKKKVGNMGERECGER